MSKDFEKNSAKMEVELDEKEASDEGSSDEESREEEWKRVETDADDVIDEVDTDEKEASAEESSGEESKEEGVEKTRSMSQLVGMVPKSLLKASGTLANLKKKMGGKKITMKTAIDAQTTLANDKGSIWNEVFIASDGVLKFFEENRDDIFDNIRDPAGATPFLLLFLYGGPAHCALATKLIERQPELIFSKYALDDSDDDIVKGNPAKKLLAEAKQAKKAKKAAVPDLYSGETALHLAVVNNNTKMVKLLLDTQIKLRKEGDTRDLLTMAATGIFFDEPLSSGPCYYGHIPLGFAACTGNSTLLTLLLSYGADLYIKDKHGLNLLHLLVLHELPQMYQFVRKLEASEREKLTEEKRAATLPLDRHLTNDGYSPLSLAAKSGSKEMFGLIIESQRTTQWTYGPIQASIFPLCEIDTIFPRERRTYFGMDPDDEKNPCQPRSCIEEIIKFQHLELLMHKTPVSVLSKKWSMYASDMYKLRCLKQTALTAALTISVILGYPDATVYEFGDAASAARSLFRLGCELVIILSVIHKSWGEYCEMKQVGGIKAYYNRLGVAFLENFLSSTYCSTMLINMVLRLIGVGLGQSLTVDKFFLAISVFFAWSYCLTLLLGFKTTGQFVIMIHNMWVGDVLKFSLIYFVVLLGFASTTFVLEKDQGEGGGTVFFGRIHTLFMVMMGEIDLEEFAANASEEWGGFFMVLNVAILLLHVMVVTIMLLNLLIAMMGDTYADIKEQSAMEWQQCNAQIIMSLEGELPVDKTTKQIKLPIEKQYWLMNDDEVFLQTTTKLDSFFEAAKEKLTTILAGDVFNLDTAFAEADQDGNDSISKAELATLMEKQRIELRAKFEEEFKSKQADFVNVDSVGAGFQSENKKGIYD